MNACTFQPPPLKHLIPSITHQTPNSLSISQYHTSNPFKLNHSKKPQISFDESACESERLRLDAKARESMAIEAAEDPKAWKWVIRKRIWDLMEARKIAQFPRPVHHRIPNFVGAAAAADKLSRLEVFMKADSAKVNPDTPQKQVRFLTIDG